MLEGDQRGRGGKLIITSCLSACYDYDDEQYAFAS